MNKRKLSFFGLSLLLPVVALVLLITAVSPQTTHAAPNPIVDTLNDENDGECATDCSLRDAIALADAGSTITVDASVSGTIVLSTTLGELLIDKNLTIDGGNVITVSGNNATRVFNVTAGNVTFDSLTIISGTVTIDDCGGFGSYTCGGGIIIQNSGVVVTVTNSTLSGNSSRFGGSIYNWHGTITITNSILSGNSANNDGGGIYNSGGTLTINNSTLSSNSATRGSGIFNYLSTVTIDSSILSRNSASSGGGIYNYLSTVEIDNSTLFGNETGGFGGGIHNFRATVAIDNSTISGNSANVGGGINTSEGTVTVTNSTISGNWAGNSGGGIYTSEGTLAIDNSTLSDNSAVYYGGGINNLHSTLTINNSTVFGNQAGNSIINGGGIASYGDASTFTTLTNSIVIGNVISGTTTAADVSLASAPADSFTSGGHNLIGAIAPNITAFINGINGDQTGVTNPALGPLAYNGGATLTHALLIGSPAIDAGDCYSGPTTDQRGVARPQDSTCDIGAFESDAQSGPNLIVNINDDSDDGSCNALIAGVADCTLREAINAANALAGDDTITFAPAVSGTIVLSPTLGDLDISSTMAIDGGHVITVSGNNATRVFNVTAGNVTFDSLSIISGSVKTTDCGGGDKCGGGIMIKNSGVNVTVTNSTLSGNRASSSGGGIYSRGGGTVTVNNSTLSDNETDINGGGISNYGGTLIVNNSTLSHNSSDYGGGIYNGPDSYNGNRTGTVTINNSTLSDNETYYYGAGIYNVYDGTVTVSNSTLSGNQGAYGAGIYNRLGGTVIVSNSTLTRNSSTRVARGGGIADDGSSTTIISNTIVADNVPGNCALYGTPNGNASNLADDDSCTGFTEVADVLLGPLADNGGDTLTHALQVGSPAIDAGDCTSGPATDQRGIPRPQNTSCDIGAIEAPSGILTGLVVDDGSNLIEGAVIRNVTDVILTTLTNGNGVYTMTFGIGNYDVTASAWGYVPVTVNNITILSGTTTTQNFTVITPATPYLVEGIITDAATGWPLYASIDIPGNPAGSIWTDPVTGYYSVTLFSDTVYVFTVNAWSAGYHNAQRLVGPLSSDSTEDFALDANLNSCDAPGYAINIPYSEDFEINDGGYTVYTESGSNSAPWEWGQPITWPSGCAEGSTCWGTNLTGLYNNDADQTLTSPLIDLTAVTSGTPLEVRWQQANHIETRTYDQADAEISINGGAWTSLWQNASGSVQDPWRELTYDITAAAGNNVQFRWKLNSDSTVSYDGFYIDSVIISSYCLPPTGGLVVGNVYDAATNSGISGATVENEDGFNTTSITATGSAGAGFYALYSPSGSKQFTATVPASSYGTDSKTPTVVAGQTVRQDFYLDVEITGLTAVNDSPTTLGQTTMLTASISAGSNIIYSWDFGDGNSGSGTIIGHMYGATGSYTATVTATNSINSQVATTIVVLEPNTIFLPIVFNNYISAPDLVVADVVVSGDEVMVIITNEGNTPVSDPFWVDVYINPTTPPTGINQTWETNGGEGLVWGIETPSLAPGETMTLTLSSATYFAQFSNFSGTITTGSTLYVQVDSAGSFDYGNVQELDESNNIYGPMITAVSSTPAGVMKTAVYPPALTALRP